MQHWREDFMFGYQFLNGCNPVVITKCTKLPDKFPVTHEMVSVSLERELTLEQEIEVHMVMSVSVNLFHFIFHFQDKNAPLFNSPADVQCKSLLWLQAGNVYMVDYEVLDGISANCTDPCTLQYLAAPICLLYKTAHNKILPIAIQVQ